MDKQRFNEILLRFLDASPTPFHATANMVALLQKNGFEPLDEHADWQLEAGKKYYLTRNDSSIIAFTYPQGAKGYTMLGAHTDSPNLRLKPNPVIKKAGVVQFGVEPYGGVLLGPWFDRDLSIAGRISYLDESGKVGGKLCDFKRAVAVIPSLAIHLDPEVNKEHSINMQTDIVPVIACGETFDFESAVLKEAELDAGSCTLLSHELSLYDTQKASFVGVENEFIASARLDNLLSCYTALQTICSVDSDTPLLLLCSDHEEVGSSSISGASGPFLEDTLHRIAGSREAYAKLVRGSMMVSCDNAHAQHPNFANKHDDNHAPLINCGAVVKVNANQRYASNATTIARFVHAAKLADEPIQQFVARSDMGCGSTIGPITATRIGIDTIDVGLPQFAMHSIRELCGRDDAHSLYKILLTLAGQRG